MENPLEWTQAEKIIHQASRKWEEGRERGVIGFSRVMVIANALREAGLLLDEPAAEAASKLAKPILPNFMVLEDLEKNFGFTEVEVDQAVLEGRILRLETSSKFLYPAAQFDEFGATPEEMPAVLAMLERFFGSKDGWAASYWLTGQFEHNSDGPTRFEHLRAYGATAVLAEIAKAIGANK
jgi:hypothetical protein